MAQDHAHDHDHHDHHAVTLTHVSHAFVIGIAFNFLFVVLEVIVGLCIHSLSLLSDAGHNLADVAGLGLALLAFRLAEVQPSDTYTYGYRKTSILVALLNAVVLLVSIIIITYEAFQRFLHPEPLPGLIVAAVAAIGILINGGTAMLFLRHKDKDINVKGAYLHLASDALVSLALVVGGIVIYFTHLYVIDAVLSIAVAVVIVSSTWKLLKNSLRLSLDGVPDTIDAEQVRTVIRRAQGVKDIHHVHIWAIGTTTNALTAHIVLEDNITSEAVSDIKHKIRHELLHLNIQHATLETEYQDQNCHDATCREPEL